MRTSSTISDAERALILGGNASSFFGLSGRLAAGSQLSEAASLLTPAAATATQAAAAAAAATQAEGGSASLPKRSRPPTPSSIPSPPSPSSPFLATQTTHRAGAGTGRGASARGVHTALTYTAGSCALANHSMTAGRAPWGSRSYATSAFVIRQRLASLAPYSEVPLTDGFVSGATVVTNHIAGQPAATAATLPLIDAATGLERGCVSASDASDVQAAVSAARDAYARSGWAEKSFAERAAVLMRAADLLDADAEAYALAEARDVGKPLSLARSLDVPRAAANLRMFAGLVQHGTLNELRPGGGGA